MEGYLDNTGRTKQIGKNEHFPSGGIARIRSQRRTFKPLQPCVRGINRVRGGEQKAGTVGICGEHVGEAKTVSGVEACGQIGNPRVKGIEQS